MTSDDEKNPPVPADLVGAPKRIQHEQPAENQDPSGDNALPDEQHD